jgi:hypothetical protein
MSPNFWIELDYGDGGDAEPVVFLRRPPGLLPDDDDNGCYLVWVDSGKCALLRDWDEHASAALERGESLEFYVRWDRKVACFWAEKGEVVLGYPARDSDMGAFYYKERVAEDGPLPGDFVPVVARFVSEGAATV